MRERERGGHTTQRRSVEIKPSENMERVKWGKAVGEYMTERGGYKIKTKITRGKVVR